jgi:hypothetical protein
MNANCFVKCVCTQRMNNESTTIIIHVVITYTCFSLMAAVMEGDPQQYQKIKFLNSNLFLNLGVILRHDYCLNRSPPSSWSNNMWINQREAVSRSLFGWLSTDYMALYPRRWNSLVFVLIVCKCYCPTTGSLKISRVAIRFWYLRLDDFLCA